MSGEGQKFWPWWNRRSGRFKGWIDLPPSVRGRVPEGRRGGQAPKKGKGRDKRIRLLRPFSPTRTPHPHPNAPEKVSSAKAKPFRLDLKGQKQQRRDFK